MSCPNLINDGPSLLSACAIRIPSGEFLYSFDFIFPNEIINVKISKRILNLIFFLLI